MNLPFVMDIAIGLIFIFLILSLLASEIQELLTTLLQWRAKHLKDAIEILLAGGVGTQEEEQVRDLVHKLYDDPLLKNINQEAKGWAGKVRGITRWLIPGNQRGSFGAQRSTGPSYIAPETFATSILERVGLATLVRKLIEVRLERFAKRIIGTYHPNPGGGPKNQVILPADEELENSWDQGRVRLIARAANLDLHRDGNFKILVEEFDDILNDFKSGETSLATSVERMGESFSTYIANYPIPASARERDTGGDGNPSVPHAPQPMATTEAEIPPSDVAPPTSGDPDPVYFAKRLKSLKLGIFGEKGERAIASGGLRPSLLEIAELLNRSSGTYQEVVGAYQTLVVSGKALDDEVLPRLQEKLLTSHHVDVIEQQLVISHLDEVVAALATVLQSTTVLQGKYSRWHNELKQKLDNNTQQLHQAEAEARKPLRRRRGLMRRTRTWCVRQWRKMTIATPKAVQQRRRLMVLEMIDRLPEEKQLELTRAILASLSGDGHKLYGDIEQGYFGVMDHALDRLTHEERHQLIHEVLTDLGYQRERRSLYEHYQSYKTIQFILSRLPNSVKESFAILARRAQVQARETGNDVHQFRQELADWFDHSMSRASGVYKRNAKGVGMLIGLLLVMATNVDAGFVVERLSDNENLRNVVAERAVSLQEGTLDDVRTQADEALRELALPIGWNLANLTQQLHCPLPETSPDLPSNWSEFYAVCLGQSPATRPAATHPLQVVLGWGQDVVAIALTYPLSLLRILLGWLVAGIAISMGAPFWFDLLGKIINVRNAGGKPPSADTQSVAKPASAELSIKRES